MGVVANPVLMRFRKALDNAYGDRLERVVLFGSRARGDERPDSDYDVAIFLEGIKDFDAEAQRLAEIETRVLCDTGAVIHSLAFEAGAYRQKSGLMHEMRREGVDL